MNVPESFRPKKNLDSKLVDLLVREPKKIYTNSDLKKMPKVFEALCEMFSNDRKQLDDLKDFFDLDFLKTPRKVIKVQNYFNSVLSRFDHHAPFTVACLLFCESYFCEREKDRGFRTKLEDVADIIQSLDGPCINFIDILDRAHNTNKRFFNSYIEDFMIKSYAKLLKKDLKKPAEYAIRAIIFPYIYQGSKKSPQRKKSVDARLRPYISKYGYCDTCLDKSSEIIHHFLKSKVAYHVKEVSNVLKGIYIH